MSRTAKALVAGSVALLAAACAQAQSATAPVAQTVTSATATTTVVPPKPAPPTVAEAQQILHDLGYQARGVNGTLDDETKHAIVAFQKVQGLLRTGVIDDATATALRSPSPKTIKPQHATAGTHLEVDIAHQVDYTVVDGAVNRIYDVSTGDNTGDRVTPLGDFHVYYQINFWEYAPLGRLYRPSYITTTGIAVHGGEDVAPVPASNGCVRMTDQSIDDVYPLLHPGAEVLIF
ncbi:L,D-transpeptidase family protein [Kutzneria sp. CA-103260]|uniref:L,D-transpeptidase family protein n=1 Tax=Kutzneria sp. CA-103260 TaxID=2802641 RepID=UPI001BAB2F76|nr:L,D-transpeptidase family protein [Kutzneria sp. CA-103260]QUQ66917.1 L,D-transpeptidase catalytic domain [Kutzneria sp. CA-103260]